MSDIFFHCGFQHKNELHEIVFVCGLVLLWGLSRIVFFFVLIGEMGTTSFERDFLKRSIFVLKIFRET